MGSKYPVLTPKEIIRTLEKFGFSYVSQKGSHMKYSNADKVVIIPNHSEVAKGTLKSILTMANVSLDDFIEKLEEWSKWRGENYAISCFIFLQFHSFLLHNQVKFQ